MKRCFAALFAVFLLVFSSAPAFAIDTTVSWPPEPSSQVPNTILEPDYFSDFSSIFSGSMASVGSIGLKLLSALLVVFLIGSIFWNVLRAREKLRKDVESRAYRRNVKLEDMSVNRTDTLDEMVVDREYGMIADARFRAKNWDMLVTDHVHRMELQHAAKEEYRSLHLDWDIDDVVYRKKINLLGFAKLHEDYSDAYGVEQDINAENRRYYRLRHESGE